MTVKEFLNRYDNGDTFSEEELKELFDLDLDDDETDDVALP